MKLPYVILDFIMVGLWMLFIMLYTYTSSNTLRKWIIKTETISDELDKRVFKGEAKGVLG